MVSINNRFGNYNVQVGQVQKNATVGKINGKIGNESTLKITGSTQCENVTSYSGESIPQPFPKINYWIQPNGDIYVDGHKLSQADKETLEELERYRLECLIDYKNNGAH